MATTTNYGWTTPDDTALVKDGAAAIRTLGSSIDTTTKNLNPSTTLGDIEYRSSTANVNTRLPLGTAGQVLKVNSGATAPEWATDASGMTNPMTTTGDTIYSSSGSTPARLGIGTAGQVLRVNSGATAPEWATPSSTPTFVGARAGIVSGSQQIANNTNTLVNFTSETFQPNFDTDNIHSTSTNTSRFTVPSGKGGYWLCIATIQFESNGNGIRVGEFILNTDLVTKGFRQVPSSATDTVYSCSTILKLAAGDYVEFRVFQNSGVQLAVVADSYNNQFAFSYLGA
jgi:hypothetical protein